MIQPRQANFASFLPFHLTLSPKRMAAWKCGLVGWYIFREWRLRKSSEESDLQVPQNSDKFRTELITWTLKDAIKMDDTPNPWHGVSIDKSPAKWFSRIVFYIRWVSESLQGEEGFHMKSLKLVDLTSNCPKRGSQLWNKIIWKPSIDTRNATYIRHIYVYIHCNMHVWIISILQFVRLPINFRAPDSGNISQNVKRIGFPGNLTNPMKSFIQPVEIPLRIIPTWM